jgi:hypothetical protein
LQNMKKITALLVGCSLAIAGTVIAQQPEGQESPSKRGNRPEKTQQGAPAETKQKSNAGAPGSKSNATEPTQTGGKQRGQGQGGGKSQSTMNAESSPATETNAGQQEGGKKGRHSSNATTNTADENAPTASPGVNQAEQGKKGRKNRGETATTSPAPSAAAATSPARSTTNAAANATTNTVVTNAPGAGNLKGQGTVGRGGKRVERQQVQQIKQQHASFKAQPKLNVAPAVTFNQNYRISGAESWQGPQYEVFRSYHPEWHDQGWYHSHYGQVVLIAGGWYFLNRGYWYPAWGYDSSAAYYAYDGPIYVGQSARPPDQVIADVQSELQDMGYYQGEVDGLLGPLTRQALRDYQEDHGLMVTEVIDEPTLDELQLG